MGSAGGPNYVRVLLGMLDRGEIQRGELSECVVLHDDWCRQLHGKGWCNCNPRIEIMRPPKGDPKAS